MAEEKTYPDYTLGNVMVDNKETRLGEVSIIKSICLEVQESDNCCLKGDCNGDYCIAGG